MVVLPPLGWRVTLVRQDQSNVRSERTGLNDVESANEVAVEVSEAEDDRRLAPVVQSLRVTDWVVKEWKV